MSSTSRPWHQRIFRSSPSLKDLNLIFWGLLLLGFVAPFSIIVISSGRPPDGDFAGFYSLGRILNEHPIKDLYNFELLSRICMEVHPRSGAYGPLPYPPFVGLFFRPFALLPYWVAYLAWVTISLTLYVSGLTLALAEFFPVEPLRRSLVVCLAFCYAPFIVDTAASGQLSAVSLFALVMVLREDDLDHRFRSGLALSVYLFKPTLLVLLLPMVLATRRWRTFLGFVAGAAGLFLVAAAFEGFGIWPVFFHSILSYGKLASGPQASSIRILNKYVDLSSLSALAPGGRSQTGLAIFFTVACCAFLALLRFWWKSSGAGRPFNNLLWAATITWTLLLNVYVPIYDSTLIVLALIVAAGAFKRIPSQPLHRWFTTLWVLVLICSWFTVALAGIMHFQIITVLFIALGVLQFVGLNRLDQSPFSKGRAESASLSD
jgi:hypothetical protein